MNPLGEQFRLGINYWPSGAALQWWERFDAGVVAADFARIAAAGFDSVRFFLTWEAFQPAPARVDATMVGRLVQTADLAHTAGLRIVPTLFTGHMSGVNLLPAWAVQASPAEPRFRILSGGKVQRGEPRTWYGNDDIAPAQALLAGTGASALAGHPALWAWDLGNENSNCSIPATVRDGRDWLHRMNDVIRAADPGAAVTIGLHMEDLESDRRLGPADAATVCDFLCMHGYPIYATWAGGPTDDRLLAFLTEITRWLAGGAAVLFSEFGLPTEQEAPAAPMLVTETAAAAYTDRALNGLHAAGATGAMLWCANDYGPELWRDPPFDVAHHERHFGLWRSDRSPKAALAAVARHRGLMVLEPAAPTWIDIEPAEFYTPSGSHLARLYGRYGAAKHGEPRRPQPGG